MRTKICLALIVFFVLIYPGNLVFGEAGFFLAEDGQLCLESIPTEITEFTRLADELSEAPIGGVTAFLLAHLISLENPALGEQCLIYSLDKATLRRNPLGSRAIDYHGLGLTQDAKKDFELVRRRPDFFYSFVIEANPVREGRKIELPFSFWIEDILEDSLSEHVFYGVLESKRENVGFIAIKVRPDPMTGSFKVFDARGFYGAFEDRE